MFENKHPVVMSEIFTECTFIKATVYTDVNLEKNTESLRKVKLLYNKKEFSKHKYI